jgi:hypothetical protein
MIYINEAFVKSGTYQAKLKPGIYNYRVESPKYHTEAGKIEITGTRKELNIQLKPAFGFISVTSEPETGATIMIDGETFSQTTPSGNIQLSSGDHTVQVIMENYQPATRKVTIIDGNTISVNFLMSANFSEVNITTLPNAEIFIDNDSKGKGVWQGRLGAGIYTLEGRLDKHKTAKKDIEVVAGENQKIDLSPSPLYGSIDLVTNPAGATIGINGKTYGTTPNTISDLFVGEYNIKLIKQGFTNIEKTILIHEGKTIGLNETMTAIQPVTKKPPKLKAESANTKELKPASEYLKYKKSKTIWLITGLVTASAGTFCYLQANKYYSAYQDATTDSEIFYQMSKTYDTIYPICFALAGLCTVEFIVKSGKQKKVKSQSVGFYTKPIYDGAGLGIVYNF